MNMSNFRIITLGLLTTLAVVISCGGDEPAQKEVPTPSAPSNIVLHSSTQTSLTFQWDMAENAVKYEWSISEGGSVIQKGLPVSRLAMFTIALLTATSIFSI